MLSRFLERLKRRKRPQASELPDDESGAVAIEFAFTMPILIAIFFGVAEICYFNMNSRRAQQSVDFAAEYMSRDDDGLLTDAERHLVEDIWQVVNSTSFINTGGHAYTNSRGKYARSFSAVEFERTPVGCTPELPDCELSPKLNWSFLATQGIASPKRRSCEQTVVDNNARLNETTIPEGMVGRGAVVIADFTYKYVPFFESGPFPEFETHVFAMRATRGGAKLRHVDMSTSHLVRCI